MKIRSHFLALAILLFALQLQAQTDSVTVNKQRLKGVLAGQTVAYTGMLVGLSNLWYTSEKTSFHSFDDFKQWNQIDKCGHIFTTYHLSRANTALYSWAGVPEQKAVLWGSIVGFLYMTPIEVLDGLSPDYGFSWSDLGANALGAGMYYVQARFLERPLVKPKFSYHATSYPKLRPEVLGSNWYERIIKDYNGQTYWLSLDMYQAFFRGTDFPKWLNLSLGYGADQMVYATQEANQQAGFTNSRSFYLSLDLDLSHYKTKSKVLNTLIFIADGFRLIPFPTLEWDSKSSWDIKPYYF